PLDDALCATRSPARSTSPRAARMRSISPRTVRQVSLEHRAVGCDLERRLAAAQTKGELAAGGPRATFQDARERQLRTTKLSAHALGQIVEQCDGESAPFDDDFAADVPDIAAIDVVGKPQHSAVDQQASVAVFGQ